MGIRRTREQKIIASLRRELKEGGINSPEEKQSFKVQRRYYTPTLELPSVEIKRDLVKTGLYAGLALVFQLGLYEYLQRGGWDLLRK